MAVASVPVCWLSSVVNLSTMLRKEELASKVNYAREGQSRRNCLLPLGGAIFVVRGRRRPPGGDVAGGVHAAAVALES